MRISRRWLIWTGWAVRTSKSSAPTTFKYKTIHHRSWPHMATLQTSFECKSSPLIHSRRRHITVMSLVKYLHQRSTVITHQTRFLTLSHPTSLVLTQVNKIMKMVMKFTKTTQANHSQFKTSSSSTYGSITIICSRASSLQAMVPIVTSLSNRTIIRAIHTQAPLERVRTRSEGLHLASRGTGVGLSVVRISGRTSPTATRLYKPLTSAKTQGNSWKSGHSQRQERLWCKGPWSLDISNNKINSHSRVHKRTLRAKSRAWLEVATTIRALFHLRSSRDWHSTICNRWIILVPH